MLRQKAQAQRDAEEMELTADKPAAAVEDSEEESEYEEYTDSEEEEEGPRLKPVNRGGVRPVNRRGGRSVNNII